MTGYFSNLLRYTKASSPRRGTLQTSLPKQTSGPTAIIEQHERILIDGDRSAEGRSAPGFTQEDSLPVQNEMERIPGSKSERSPEVKPVLELPAESKERDQPAVIKDPSATNDPPSFEVKTEIEGQSIQDRTTQRTTESLEEDVSIERREQQRSNVATQPGQLNERSLQGVDSPPERIEPHELHATIEIHPSERIRDSLSEPGPADVFPTEDSYSSKDGPTKKSWPSEARGEHVDDVDERQVIWKQVYQDVRAWVADDPAVETVLDKPLAEEEDIHIVERVIPQSDQKRSQPVWSENQPISQRIESQELELSIGSINVTIETPEAPVHNPAPQAGNLNMREPPSSLSRDYLRLR